MRARVVDRGGGMWWSVRELGGEWLSCSGAARGAGYRWCGSLSRTPGKIEVKLQKAMNKIAKKYSTYHRQLGEQKRREKALYHPARKVPRSSMTSKLRGYLQPFHWPDRRR